MSFRGINTTVIQIRRQVFTEVARMAYANVKGEQANHLMRKIPYTIIPGEEGKLRKDIFLERAIVEERVRLAMGLPTRRMDEHNSVVSGLELPGKAGQGLRPVSGLPCPPLYGSVPQEGHHMGERPFHHRSGQVHQVRPLRRRVPLQRHRQDRASLRCSLRHGCHPLR